MTISKKKAKIVAFVSIALLVSAVVYCSTLLWSRSSEAFTEFFVEDEQSDEELSSESFPSDPKLRDGGSILSESTLEGTDDDDCIVFGRLYYLWGDIPVSLGIGICVFQRVDGECRYWSPVGVDWEGSVVDVYKVVAKNGSDYVRFASSTRLSCGNWYDYPFYVDSAISSTYDGKTQLFYGDAGNDTLFTCYYYGSSTCWTNAGSRNADGRGDNDKLYGGNLSDSLWGGTGSDSLYGGSGVDYLFGWDGDDYLSGGGYADRLYGEANDDTMYGGSGADTLWGGFGNDCMYGESQDDTLYGDSGYELLDGGDGTDYCACSDGHGKRENCYSTPDACDGTEYCP